MNNMRNFILAVTSFIATVVLLSQVALAQDDGWDPKHTVSAPGDEPAINLNSGRSPEGQKTVEGEAPKSGANNQNPCTTCTSDQVHVPRMGDTHTVPGVASQTGAPSSPTGKPDGNKGER